MSNNFQQGSGRCDELGSSQQPAHQGGFTVHAGRGGYRGRGGYTQQEGGDEDRFSRPRGRGGFYNRASEGQEGEEGGEYRPRGRGRGGYNRDENAEGGEYRPRGRGGRGRGGFAAEGQEGEEGGEYRPRGRGGRGGFNRDENAEGGEYRPRGRGGRGGYTQQGESSEYRPRGRGGRGGYGGEGPDVEIDVTQLAKEALRSSPPPQPSPAQMHKAEEAKAEEDNSNRFAAAEEGAYSAPRGRGLRGRGRGGDEGGLRGRGRGRNVGDPTLTRPGRTQRAPHLRQNNFEDHEVEALFSQHHNQKGISFDNYNNISVDIIPTDIEAAATFTDLKVERHLAENIARCGYKNPTPVQKYGIPVTLAGNDLLACAQTGSGKTAAFLIPVMQHILLHGVSPAQDRMSCPIAIVLAPIRELALQIYEEARKLAFRTDIFLDVAYGGTGYPQRFEQDVLVACPGRLKDLFDRERISFSCVKFLILDEADRMLEMGFEEQIRYLVSSRFSDMPGAEERQTLMFSATFPKEIRDLARDYLRRRHYLLTVGRVGSTTKNITQKLRWVEDDDKRDALMDIVQELQDTDLVLVFVETKRLANDLYYYLDKLGIPTETIHGDRAQHEREAALRDFKSGKCPILVATDVASRGLDIPNVAHVIQYDLPTSMDDYTHRIGRTGRAGNKGTAFGFFNKNNYGIAADLITYMREHEQDIPDWADEVMDDIANRNFGKALARGRGGRGGGGGGRGGRSRDDDIPDEWDPDAGRSSASRGATKGRGGGGARAAVPMSQKYTSNYDDGGF